MHYLSDLQRVIVCVIMLKLVSLHPSVNSRKPPLVSVTVYIKLVLIHYERSNSGKELPTALQIRTDLRLPCISEL